jgi:pheromone shutdown-related protein TraB
VEQRETGSVETASYSSSSEDVQSVSVDGRTFTLVGTAHVSRESAELVRHVVSTERPDCVCIELDRKRFVALAQRHRFESLNIREVIRSKQLPVLLLNLVLAAYQKQLGGALGVVPGTELLAAATVAEDLGIPIELCDRDVRITLRRAWSSIPWWRKLWLVPGMLVSVLFERPSLSEADLRTLRQRDVMTNLLQELGEALPELKRALIDERDSYLAEKMRRSPGRHLVAVVGAGHIDGIRRGLMERSPVALQELETVPPTSRFWSFVGWGVPLTILAALLAIGLRKGAAVAGENLLFWVLANGIPCSIGAAVAFAHPATIVAAFVAAPITSLTPVIGAGYVTAFAQAYLCPPLVREIQSVADDFLRPRRWWGNRLLRVLLVFLLTTIGSAIGTFVGGAEIVRNVF